LALVIVLALFAFSWEAGVLALIAAAAAGVFAFRAEQKMRAELNAYIATISHRVKRASGDVIADMPIGIVLYDEDRQIEWHNGYIAKIMEQESLVGESLQALWPALKSVKDKDATVELAVGKRSLQVR